MYAPQRPHRDGSIFSESSWESETLKNEILYLCRHPDAGPGNGELYWSPNDSSLFESPVRPPSIRYPGPTRVKPQLHLNTHTNSVRPSIIAATSVDTNSSPRVSPVDEKAARSISLSSDNSPLSRNPSLTSTLQPGTEAALTRPSAMPPVPKIPDIPELSAPSKAKTKHTRQKSSVSSRKFLPRDWLLEPLSEDPQIRALASPPGSPEIEATPPSIDGEKEVNPSGGVLIPNLPSPPAPTASPTGRKSSDDTQSGSSNSNSSGVRTRRRSMTAPGNPPPVLPPVPLTVRKSRTSIINPTPRSIHHPHHPNYVPPAVTPKPSTEGLNRPSATRTSPAPASNSSRNINHNNRQPLQRHKSTSTSTSTRLPPRRQQSIGHHRPHPRFSPPQSSLAAHGSIKDLQRVRSSSSSFRNYQFPRRTPSHNQRLQPHPEHYQSQHQFYNQRNMTYNHLAPVPAPTRPPYTRRFHSNDGRGFDPAHTLPPIPRSDDTATLYPSTRRPRSSTHGGFSNATYPGNTGASSAQERTSTRRTSLSLADGGVALEGDSEIVERRNTYRGAERTSFCGPSSGMAKS